MPDVAPCVHLGVPHELLPEVLLAHLVGDRVVLLLREHQAAVLHVDELAATAEGELHDVRRATARQRLVAKRERLRRVLHPAQGRRTTRPGARTRGCAGATDPSDASAPRPPTPGRARVPPWPMRRRSHRAPPPGSPPRTSDARRDRTGTCSSRRRRGRGGAGAARVAGSRSLELGCPLAAAEANVEELAGAIRADVDPRIATLRALRHADTCAHGCEPPHECLARHACLLLAAGRSEGERRPPVPHLRPPPLREVDAAAFTPSIRLLCHARP